MYRSLSRLAFACEVLTNPSLFFCDEPTSGLDSYMAQNVVEVLRSAGKQSRRINLIQRFFSLFCRALAGHGKTIVCTIHQPSSQVYALFDRVLMMAEGRLAFLGEVERAKGFFQK